MRRVTPLVMITLLAFLLVACGGLPGMPANNSAAEDTVEEPIVVQEPSKTARQIAEEFLDAWNNQDLETMYSYVSPTSRELYPQQTFENRYIVAQNSLNYTGVNYTIREVVEQGTTAAITYDVTILSDTFGTIPDTGRTMRLVNTGGGWLLAWTPMDIINGLSSGARLQQETRFPLRASIYDRNGSPLVDNNGTVVVLRAVQQDMASVDNCILLLSEIFRRQPGAIARQFTNYLPETLFHVGEIDPETYFNYQTQLSNTCGIFETEGIFSKVFTYETRSYYGHGAAAHITGHIGFIPADQADFWQSRGYQSGDIVGLAGIENSYQSILAGQPQRFLRVVEPGGYTIRELQSASGSGAASVTLTIDRDLQSAVFDALFNAFTYASNNWGAIATGAAAVVLDVNTGEILAMTSYPSYDPSLFNPDSSYENAGQRIADLSADPRSPFRNKAVVDQFAPASTYKIITTTAAAAEGVWGVDQNFFCDLQWEGPPRYNDVRQVRYDWRYSHEGYAPTGDIVMYQALASSCDPFYYEMGALLFQKQPNLLAQYSELMGLGRPPDIELPEAEAPGNLAVPRTIGEAINNAIGQGNVSASPLQMAMVTATVANGGTLYQPYLVKQVGGVGAEELIEQTEPQVIRELDLPAGTLDVVQQGMCAVVEDDTYGTATLVFGDQSYTICGKTGTAQAGTAPHAWFVAYAPKEDPEIAVVVMVTNSREGSEVAAPIVRRILDYYFGVPFKPYPDWWEDDYEPVTVPEGGVAGG